MKVGRGKSNNRLSIACARGALETGIVASEENCCKQAQSQTTNVNVTQGRGQSSKFGKTRGLQKDKSACTTVES
jgi:hypothetical protein